MNFLKKIIIFAVSAALLFTVAGCDFFSDETETDNSLIKPLTTFKLNENKIQIAVGEIKYISFTYFPITYILTNYTYDKSVIDIVESSLSGVVIKGVSEGQTQLTVSANGSVSTAVIKVQGYADTYNADINPYIYSNTSVLQLSPGRSQKINVSLYGGTIADIENYSWTIDNSSIASVSPTGQYCIIEGLNEGYTRLKVTNPAATYPYYIGVYVFADATRTTYITSEDNIKTLYVSKGEETVTVDLVNPRTDTYKDKFQYKLIDGDTDCIDYVTNKNQIIVRPIKSGQCTLRVTNSEADGDYPLDIIIRVVELVNGAYINPSETTITIKGEETQFFTSTISGLTAERDYSTSDFSYEVEDDSVCEIFPFGEKCTIRGLKNGSTSIYVSHPKTLRKRQVLVIVEEQEAGSIDMDCYITTNQNYIKTKVGAEATNLTVALKGGTAEDVSNFKWEIIENPETHGQNVINVVAGNSSNQINYSSRAISSYVQGNLLITPVSIGTASIIVRNPKSFYPTEVLVKVLDENANLDELSDTAYLSTTTNVIRFPAINSSITAKITAYGISSGDYDKTEWISNDESIAKVIGNGTTAEITALSEGETTVTVTNPLAENSLTLHVYIGSKYISAEDKIKYISTNTELIATTNDDSAFHLVASLVNGEGEELYSGFEFSIDDESVAKITAQYINGNAYITPIAAGQCEISIRHPSSEIVKKILVIIKNTAEELADFKYLTTTNNVITVGEGGTKTVSVSMKNSIDVILDGYSWYSSDPSIASIQATTTGTATIVGNKKGTTLIHCQNTNCTYPIDIIVQVIDAATAASCPYIEATASVLTLSKSTAWTNVTATLVGGTDYDNDQLEWYSDDSSIIEAYGQNGIGKVRAVGAGITYLRIRHNKAVYDQLVLCVCDDGTVSEHSITVSTGNIISIQPNSEDKQITATLVNGTAVDNANFSWSLDVYDVVDLTYSANQALISPLKEGVCQLTVHHPKSAYDQKIVIKVQQFSTFGFGSTKSSVYENSTTFVDMEVPSSNVNTNVVYTIDNPEVASINGTNSILAITGRKAGTAIVHAKLMAGTAVYAETSKDLLITVLPKNGSIKYISATSTIHTMNIGDDKILSASLVGTSNPAIDEYSMHWTAGNPAVLELKGGIKNADGYQTVTGKQCYISAVGAGETTVTVSHDEVDTPLVFHVIVSGNEELSLSLNRSYIVMDKGERTEITATLDNGTNDDYKDIEWTAEKVNNVPICSILGSGKTVAVYATKSGTTKIRATHKNGATAECTLLINETRSITVDQNIWKVRPNETKNFYYTVSPADATVSAIISSTDGTQYFTCNQTGEKFDSEGRGYFTIVGMQESLANQTIKLTSSEGSYTSVSVSVSWNNSLVLDQYSITGRPDKNYQIEYKVSPPDSVIKYSNYDEYMSITDVVNSVDESYRTGYLNIIPKKETAGIVDVKLSYTNPATGKVFGNYTIPVQFNYSSYAFEITNIIIDGYFSKYDEVSNVFTLSDGDTIQFTFEPAQKNVEIENLKTEYSAYNDRISVTVSSNNKTVTIKNKDDLKDDKSTAVYKITSQYLPYTYRADIHANIEIDPLSNKWMFDVYGDTLGYDGRLGLYYEGKLLVKFPYSINEFNTVDAGDIVWKQVNKTVYISTDDFEKSAFYYLDRYISYPHDLGCNHLTYESGMTSLSTGSKVTAVGTEYKAPADSGFFDKPIPIDSPVVTFLFNMSSGKTVEKTIYLNREKHYCSRNSSDISDKPLNN